MIDTSFAVFGRYRHFVQERHRIWERRMAGEPGPWTDDPVLEHQAFCNVFRVLDHGSQWAVRELYYGEDHQEITYADAFARAWVYRHTNIPAAWERTRDDIGRYPVLNDMLDGTVLNLWHSYRQRGISIYHGAYLPGRIPAGSSNWEHAVERLETMAEHGEPFTLPDFYEAGAADRVALLDGVPSAGPFLAQQVVTDFHYSPFGGDLENESVVSGPGSIRGTKHLTGQGGKDHTVETIKELRDMWDQDPEAPYIQLDSGNRRTPSLMDVQNTLCEFDKYERRLLGYGRVRKYSPRAARPLGEVVLPKHWK